jgi:hypothetical protein
VSVCAAAASGDLSTRIKDDMKVRGRGLCMCDTEDACCTADVCGGRRRGGGSGMPGPRQLGMEGLSTRINDDMKVGSMCRGWEGAGATEGAGQRGPMLNRLVVYVARRGCIGKWPGPRQLGMERVSTRI